MIFVKHVDEIRKRKTSCGCCLSFRYCATKRPQITFAANFGGSFIRGTPRFAPRKEHSELVKLSHNLGWPGELRFSPGYTMSAAISFNCKWMKYGNVGK